MWKDNFRHKGGLRRRKIHINRGWETNKITENVKDEISLYLKNHELQIQHKDQEFINIKKDLEHKKSEIADARRRNEEKIIRELNLYNNYSGKHLFPEKLHHESEQILGEGMKHRGKKHGKGFLDNVKNSIIPVIEYGKKQLLGNGMHSHCMHCSGALSGTALNPAVYGVHHEHHHSHAKKRGRPRKHGLGHGNDILKGLETGIKTAAPLSHFYFKKLV